MTAPPGYYTNLNEHLAGAILPYAKGARILEIGCAAGRLGAHLLKEGASHYVGIERVATAAEEAKGSLSHAICGDIETMELPFDDESFDVLVAGDVLEHLVDPWKALARCSRTVRAGGLVFASLPNVNHASVVAQLLQGLWGYGEEGILDRTHLRFFTVKTAAELLASGGFTLESATATQLSNPSLDAFVADLVALCHKYGLGTERIATELTTFQWTMRGRKT